MQLSKSEVLDIKEISYKLYCKLKDSDYSQRYDIIKRYIRKTYIYAKEQRK